MATNEDRILDRPVLPLDYGPHADPGALDQILKKAMDDSIWDPETGKRFYLMENGEWVGFPVDEEGNFIPLMPDRRFEP